MKIKETIQEHNLAELNNGFDEKLGITVKPVEWKTTEELYGKGAWLNAICGFNTDKHFN